MIKDHTMTPRYKAAIIFLISLILISCATKSSVILPSTGTAMTAEWKDYNTQAEVNGAPLLKYIVAAKNVLKGPTRPHEIQDVFSTRDTRVNIFTKWTNISGRPMYKIKIYDPREVLFYERSVAYKYQSGRWIIWDDIFIKGWAASRLPGLWRADIYMDDLLVTKKNFIIGSQDKEYKQKINDQNILKVGVIPFVDYESSNRKHRYRISLYLAQMLSIDLENSNIISPFQLRNDIIRPSVTYDEYKDFLMKEINSPSSEWTAVSKKYNLDFIITGKAYDYAIHEDEAKMVIYIIDCRTKEIDEVKATYTSHSYNRHSTSGNEVIRQFYNRVYDKFLKEGISKLKK